MVISFINKNINKIIIIVKFINYFLVIISLLRISAISIRALASCFSNNNFFSINIFLYLVAILATLLYTIPLFSVPLARISKKICFLVRFSMFMWNFQIQFLNWLAHYLFSEIISLLNLLLLDLLLLKLRLFIRLALIRWALFTRMNTFRRINSCFKILERLGLGPLVFKNH